MIPYLKELGINCIELLPTFEFDDLEYNGTFEGKTLYNYWGYNTVGFFAPKAAYAKASAATKAVLEFKKTGKLPYFNAYVTNEDPQSEAGKQETV